jgi:hypothetical protein
MALESTQFRRPSAPLLALLSGSSDRRWVCLGCAERFRWSTGSLSLRRPGRRDKRDPSDQMCAVAGTDRVKQKPDESGYTTWGCQCLDQRTTRATSKRRAPGFQAANALLGRNHGHRMRGYQTDRPLGATRQVQKRDRENTGRVREDTDVRVVTLSRNFRRLLPGFFVMSSTWRRINNKISMGPAGRAHPMR